MTLSELRERVWRELLDFTWRQWAQAGVSASTSGLDRWAIDPEALTLFTIGIARRDPRLFDEVLDWLVTNRQLLSLQRLKNLGRRFPLDVKLVEAVTAWTGYSSALPEAVAQRNQAEEEPVFAPDILSFIGEPDPIFAKYGYIRPRVVPSGKSREPDVRIPANFSFQLRRLFGPGSRAEVMKVLLTLEEGYLDAARIADEAGFAKRNINDTLSDLVAARVVKARWSKHERHFIAYRDKWATLLEVGPSAKFMPEFMSWVHLLPASLEIADWLDRTVESGDSEYLIASRARDLIEGMTTNLEITGLDTRPRFPSHGVAYLSTFVDMVESLLGKLSLSREG
jgi:hypothetical protein